MVKADKGDLIRIVVGSYYTEEDTEDLAEGNIYEVDHIDEDGDVIFFDKNGDTRYISDHSRYVIHRKAGEEDEVDVVYESYIRTYDEPKEKPVTTDVNETRDAVNSPQHYRQGRFETIEIIEEITQGYEDGYVAYCVGNALKYLARAPFKHGEPTEDIAKAAKYLEFATNRLKQQ